MRWPNGSEIHLVSPVLVTDGVILDTGGAENILLHFEGNTVMASVEKRENCSMCHIVNDGEIKDGPKPVR